MVLVSVASSLPPFCHPFINAKFSQFPTLGDMTDEEGMDKARNHILEGLHWINDVSLQSKARVVASSSQCIKFQKASKLLEDIQENYHGLEREKIVLA